jgi:hypothetical protein
LTQTGEQTTESKQSLEKISEPIKNFEKYVTPSADGNTGRCTRAGAGSVHRACFASDGRHKQAHAQGGHRASAQDRSIEAVSFLYDTH